MAKFAINMEGVESLNTLANGLLVYSNNIVEKNQQLEQMISLISDDLGVYGDEIYGIINRNKQTLNNNKDDIIELAIQVKKYAQYIEGLVSENLCDNHSVKSESIFRTKDKIGGLFGKRKGQNDNNTVIPFGDKITVSQDKMNSERYFVNGNHSEQYMDYWTHLEEFSEITVGNDSIIYIKAKDIEGIPLSSREVCDVEGFWGRRTGGTQESFVEIAREIPSIKKLLDSGMDYAEIRSRYPELSDCVGIYFEDAPSVSMLEDFYVFVGNGRHREMAVQIINGMIPVRVKSIITRK